MLKKVSPLISPELLKIIAEMGHGDDIVLVDANFPAASSAATNYVVANGIDTTSLLDALLELLPVDWFVEQPISLMEPAAVDDYVPDVYDDYYDILQKHGVDKKQVRMLERHEYYRMTDEAYCVVSTGERRRYANIAIKKGILEPNE